MCWTLLAEIVGARRATQEMRCPGFITGDSGLCSTFPMKAKLNASERKQFLKCHFVFFAQSSSSEMEKGSLPSWHQTRPHSHRPQQMHCLILMISGKIRTKSFFSPWTNRWWRKTLWFNAFPFWWIASTSAKTSVRNTTLANYIMGMHQCTVHGKCWR